MVAVGVMELVVLLCGICKGICLNIKLVSVELFGIVGVGQGIVADEILGI